MKYCSSVAQSAKKCLRVLKMQNSAPNSKKCSKGAQRNRERPSHEQLSRKLLEVARFSLRDITMAKLTGTNELNCQVNIHRSTPTRTPTPPPTTPAPPNKPEKRTLDENSAAS